MEFVVEFVIWYSVTLFYITVWMMLYNLFCNSYVLGFVS